jgi:selenocysteine lyase/cysteine desulfurase
MNDPGYSEDFGPFEGRVWLNSSHQGPIPRVAADAAMRAVEMKVAPFPLVEPGLFQEVPRRLREALARLIGVNADDVILGNSTSYGLTVVARGLEWREGDEVLLVEGDFPAAIFPWLVLEAQGVRIRRITPTGRGVTARDLRRELRPTTRVFCTTWVHSFGGHAVDAGALGAACRDNGTLFVLNASQGMGARVFDARESGADVVTSCGFKYLCGPYGTGFCWIRPDLRDAMRPPKGYWLAHLTADDLAGDFKAELRSDAGARAFDVSGTANFFNVMTWTASVEYLLERGIDRIAAWDQHLVSLLVSGLVARGWDLVSPAEGAERTTVTVVRGRSPDDTKRAFSALRARGIFVAMRRGNIRISPHLFNTPADVDAALQALGLGAGRWAPGARRWAFWGL